MFRVDPCAATVSYSQCGRAVAVVIPSLLSFASLLSNRAKQIFALPARFIAWKQLDVKIMARGSHVANSTGNMDSCLALISPGRNGTQPYCKSMP
jgi:hypothetical protein